MLLINFRSCWQAGMSDTQTWSFESSVIAQHPHRAVAKALWRVGDLTLPPRREGKGWEHFHDSCLRAEVLRHASVKDQTAVTIHSNS
jgi:hypothetical protein